MASGIWDVNDTGTQVARLYDTALGRLPDTSGLSFWTNAIENGSALRALADAFVGSTEFQATYGALSNRAFVDRVYQNTLGRLGDDGGTNFWTGQLDAGVSRAEVVIGFSESTEHQARTQANVISEYPVQFGIRAT